MIEPLKYSASLSATAVASLTKLLLLAFVSYGASLAVALAVLFTAGTAAAPHAGQAAAFALLTSRPVQCLAVLLIALSIYPLVTISIQYALRKVVHRVVQEKGETTLVPLMNKAIDRFRQERPAVLGQAADTAWTKLQLLHGLQAAGGNPWVRRALGYAFKKARLDDIPFDQDGLRTSEVVRDRTMQAMHEMSAPDKRSYWIVIALQWVLVLVSYLLR